MNRDSEMTFNLIDSDLLSQMGDALSLSAGFQVSRDDELEYFEEVNPSGWVAAISNDGSCRGFIRNFMHGDWSQVEVWVAEHVVDRRFIAEEMIGFFLKANSFQAGEKFRTDVLEQDHVLNDAIRKLGLSQRQEVYLRMEAGIAACAYNVSENYLRDGSLIQLVEVFSELHRVTTGEVEAWLNQEQVRCICVGDKIVAAAHIVNTGSGLEVVRIATLDEHRRQGHAEMLLKQIMMEFRGGKIEKLFLKVNQNLTPAVRLYEKLQLDRQDAATEVWHWRVF